MYYSETHSLIPAVISNLVFKNSNGGQIMGAGSSFTPMSSFKAFSLKYTTSK